jgi:hypothetical protein
MTALAACGAGHDAVTNRSYSPGDGVLATSADGTLKIQNALVVAPASAGGDAIISMAIAERGGQGDVLQQVSAGDVGSVQLVSGSTEIPADSTLTLGPGEAPTGNHAVVVIKDPQVKAGDVVPLELTFRRAGTISLKTLMMPLTDYYSNYTPPASVGSTTPPTGG